MSARMTPEQAAAALASMGPADFPTASAGEDVTDAQYERFVNAGRAAAGRPSLGTAGTRSPQITIRLPKAMDEQVRARAAAENTTVSQWARRLVERELAT